MRHCTVFTFLIIFFFNVKAQSLEWNRLLEEQSGGGFSYGHKTDIGTGGQITISGMFSVPVDFDPDANSSHVLSPAGDQNVFFGKYSSEGALNWVNILEGTDSITLSGMDLDGSGNVLVNGYFNDSIDLNPGPGQALYIPASANAEDFFISKYSSTGAFSWARQISSTVHVRSKDLTLDNSGNIIVAGETNGSTDFDPGAGTQIANTSDDYLFVARYNSSGNYSNSITMGVAGSDQRMLDLEVDAGGNIYIAGRFQGVVDFDPSTGTTALTAQGSDDYFIAKYNSSLQLQWAYRLGSIAAEGEYLKMEISGTQLIVTGSFQNSIDIDLKAGTNLLTSNGNYDVFLARYNLSADLQASASFGGSGKDESQALRFYNNDSIYISGHFQGTVDFDPGTGSKQLSAGGSQTLFFAAYNNSFGLNWASKISGSAGIYSANIDHMNGAPMLFGRIGGGSANFNSAWPQARNYSGPASFIAKYEKCGDLMITPTITDADCGVKNGSAGVSVQGGIAPYKYQWTSGDTLATADSLAAGSYFVTVRDVNGCANTSDPVLINDVDGPVVSVQTLVNVSCQGGNDGAIVITVSGGSLPYSYSWSTASTSKNINGLKAGIYEITVTDGDKCKSTKRISVSQPDAISVVPIISEPSCGNTDGVITAVASGGTAPYTYSWTPGGTGGTQFNVGAGVYRVLVTDAKNCTYSHTMALSDDLAADITVGSINDATCGTGGGSINVNVTGGSPGYSFLWTPGNMTTQNISGLQPGEYDLIVTDAAPCKAAFSAEVKAVKSAAPEICLVDVDSATGNAQVVWEKPSSRGDIDFYSIYRETTTKNVYDLIKDGIDFGDLSLYQDKYADTWIRPWSYKLSSTDTCGIESYQSTAHTTIHTVVTKNPQGDINIFWTHYKGNFPVLSYDCYRQTTDSGNQYIGKWTASIQTYVDRNPPSTGADLVYYISASHPTGCTATEAVSKNSMRSNRGSINPPKFADSTSTVEGHLELSEYRIYPNPNAGTFIMDVNSEFAGIMTVEIVDINGRMVQTANKMVYAGSNSIRFNLENLPNGFYLLQLNLNNERSFARVMINSTE